MKGKEILDDLYIAKKTELKNIANESLKRTHNFFESLNVYRLGSDLAFDSDSGTFVSYSDPSKNSNLNLENLALHGITSKSSFEQEQAIKKRANFCTANEFIKKVVSLVDNADNKKVLNEYLYDELSQMAYDGTPFYRKFVDDTYLSNEEKDNNQQDTDSVTEKEYIARITEAQLQLEALTLKTKTTNEAPNTKAERSPEEMSLLRNLIVTIEAQPKISENARNCREILIRYLKEAEKDPVIPFSFEEWEKRIEIFQGINRNEKSKVFDISEYQRFEVYKPEDLLFMAIQDNDPACVKMIISGELTNKRSLNLNMVKNGYSPLDVAYEMKNHANIQQLHASGATYTAKYTLNQILSYSPAENKPIPKVEKHFSNVFSTDIENDLYKLFKGNYSSYCERQETNFKNSEEPKDPKEIIYNLKKSLEDQKRALQALQSHKLANNKKGQNLKK